VVFNTRTADRQQKQQSSKGNMRKRNTWVAHKSHIDNFDWLKKILYMNNESSRKRSMDRRNGSVDQPAESIFEYLNNHKNNDVAHSESRPNPKTQVPIPNPKSQSNSIVSCCRWWAFSATQQGSCSWPELHKLVILHYYEPTGFERHGEVNAAYAQFLQKVILTSWVLCCWTWRYLRAPKKYINLLYFCFYWYL